MTTIWIKVYYLRGKTGEAQRTCLLLINVTNYEFLLIEYGTVEGLRGIQFYINNFLVTYYGVIFHNISENCDFYREITFKIKSQGQTPI